jgi:predicted lipid-binding transport protein (Tim44 family)
MASAGAIILKVRLSKKKVKSNISIKKLSKKDDNWNYKYIKKDIEEAFQKVGIAWMERNQDLAKEYMSEKLYNKHKMQTGWMIVRNEKNILKNMKLLGAKPIGLIDQEGTNKDCIWVHIKAKSIDYTINDETNEVIEGDRFKSVYYEEYWKFIKNRDRWILDEIRQIDDINDLDFFGIEVSKKK